jgi:hypothetical protein
MTPFDKSDMITAADDGTSTAAATGGDGGAEMRGGGEGGGNAERRLYLLLASFILLYLGKTSKIWEVPRKSPGSPQEVPRKSCLNCYRTRSRVEYARYSILRGSSRTTIIYYFWWKKKSQNKNFDDHIISTKIDRRDDGNVLIDRTLG